MAYIIDTAYMKNLRHKLGMNLEEFARIFGVSRLTVLAWEQGKAYPNNHNLAIMARLRAKLEADADLVGMRSKEIAMIVTGILATGGILAFLGWVFNDKK